MVGLALAGVGGMLLASMIGLLLHRKLRQRKIAAALVIDTPNGVSEQRFVRLGGLEQWVSIRGEDRDNPVLLVLHGGPGSSYEMFTPRVRSWEKHFTVVQWDQRGTARTLHRNGEEDCGALSFERIVEDAVELAEWLRAHLRQRKLILLGSSLGSAVGLMLARRRPDLFWAYVGTDQNVRMAPTEEEQNELCERLRTAGLSKGAAALDRMGKDASRWSAQDWTTRSQWALRSITEGPNPMKTLLLPAMWFAPGYSLLDIHRLSVGMNFSTARLREEFPAYDAWKVGTRFELPFFIFQGELDVLTPPALAAAYFADVEAPVKQMAFIRNAGHFAAFLQPEQFLAELLTRVRPLAVGAPRLLGA